MHLNSVFVANLDAAAPGRWSSPLPRERLIAASRAGFAAIALLALWLDPTEPKRFAALAFYLLAVYVAASLGLLVWLSRAPRLPARLPYAAHAIDLAVFALLILVTDGPVSPLALGLVFVLTAAAVRWSQRGVALTAAIALLVLLLTASASLLGILDGEFELNRTLIRLAQLVVVAILLGYLGAYETRLRARATELAEWPSMLDELGEGALQQTLERCAQVLGARRIVLHWEELEEPWRECLRWSAEGFTRERVADASDAPSLQLAGPINTPTDPYLPQAGNEDPGPWLCLPLRGEWVQGCLLAAGEGVSSDALALGSLVSIRVALRLDQWVLLERVRQQESHGERARLARDLHDGVLQSLAVAGLQLESARRSLVAAPAQAATIIERVQALLSSEQAELRETVRALEPRQTRAERGRVPFAQQIEALTDRVSAHWSLEISLNNALDQPPPESLQPHLRCLLLEALINASRHGRASCAQVRLQRDAEGYRIEVVDDGCGFPFDGCYDFVHLRAAGLAPASLAQRLDALGGQLSIHSSGGGATVRMTLPCAAAST